MGQEGGTQRAEGGLCKNREFRLLRLRYCQIPLTGHRPGLVPDHRPNYTSDHCEYWEVRSL